MNDDQFFELMRVLEDIEDAVATSAFNSLPWWRRWQLAREHGKVKANLDKLAESDELRR